MNIGNNMSIRNNTSFGMSMKFAPGTSIKDLEKYAIKHSLIKDENLVLKGVDKMIKDQSVNKYMDIVFDANSKNPITIQGKNLLIDMDIAINKIFPNPPYNDTIGIGLKMENIRAEQIQELKNPFRTIVSTLEKIRVGIDHLFMNRQIEKNPKLALPSKLALADYDASFYEKELNKLKTKN